MNQEVEHKSNDVDSDDEMVLHASVSGSLLDQRNSTLKKKPINTQFADDVIENDRKAVMESKVKPKLKDKNKGKRTKGEVLTPEAALDFMIKERQDFDFQCAALRAENDSLREGLEKYKHLTPSKQKNSEPEIVEKVVIKKVLDADGKKYKQDAEQLFLENEKLRQQHLEMESLLEQQRQLAEEAQRHPISQRKGVVAGTSSSRNGNHPETMQTVSASHETGSASNGDVQGIKKKTDKKSKKNAQKEAIQKSLTPVSSTNCSTFPMLLWKGGILWKIPYNGRGVPERRVVMIKRATLPGKKSKPVQLLVTNADGSTTIKKKKSSETYIANPPTIIWANPDKPSDLKNARELVLYEGAHIVLGHQSPAFWKSKNRGTPLPPEQFCFSIITSSRSLDLAAESIEEVVAWKNALHMLLVLMSPNQDWAIENLVKKQPVWHHEELENHANQKSKKKKKEEEIVTIGDDSSRYRDEAYAEATKTARQMSLKDQMFAATRCADYHKLENILQTQISVNLMEHETSDTILMIACRAGLDKIVSLCLNYGARNDPHPDFGQTALHCAVESRSYKCARVLLEEAAQSQADHIIANLRDSGDQTPLHISANFGDTKMSTILVSHGAEISSVDSKKRAPLHLCAGSGHKICLSLLLDSGGDIYIDMGDGQGNTPLHYAAENGHLTCCRLLLETAANAISRNVHQQTPYNLASLRGHQKICLLLLDYQDSAARNSIDVSPPRSGPQRSSSLNQLTSPFPQKIERNLSVPGSMPASSPMFYNQSSQQVPLYSPHGESDHCALPRPYSARVTSGGSRSDSPLIQYPSTARDVTHTNNSLMPDLNSPLMNRPHSARDRSVPLFQGLTVNSSGYLGNQQHNSLVASGNEFSVQENLHKNLFKASNNATAIDNLLPQSPVSTPNRKIPKQQHSAQKFDQNNYHQQEATDYSAPYEEFELFDTLWQVYWTEEGYPYYLDSQTQHSQWDDPRTHGLLQYDEITGELISEPTSSSLIDNDHDMHDFDSIDDKVMLQQDSFLQPKYLAPKPDESPIKRPPPKRVQSMKPQKFTANSADMSPFKTDDDDSNSDSGVDRFSVPPRASRIQQLRGTGPMKAYGTPEKISSSDAESDDGDFIPRVESRFRKERQPIQRQASSESEKSVSDSSHSHKDGSDFEELPSSQQKQNSSEISTVHHEPQRQYEDKKEHENSLHPRLRKKAAPKGPRNIPYLSADEVEADGSRRRFEDKELDRRGSSGTWFDSFTGVESHNINETLAAHSDDDLETDLDLNETVSRMAHPPGGIKPIKTNCFSPDKESLHRAEVLQRKVSSGVSSPARSLSSQSSNDERAGRKERKHMDPISDIRFLPEGNQVLVGNMQLDSDNDDDDDDFFDTIITMKKDELASAEGDVDNNSANKNDYLKFLNKVENDAKNFSPKKDESVSLAVDMDHDSDWDEEAERQNELKEKASAEKEKQMRIFDTSLDGGYGNGGNILEDFNNVAEPSNDEKDNDNDNVNSTDVLTQSHSLKVETEFLKEESVSLAKPLKSGGESPLVKPDHDSPLEVRVQPYVAFLEAGNSVRQVRRQMEKDNQPKELIKLMIQMSDDVNSSVSTSLNCSSNSSVADAAPCKATPEELAALKQDPAVGKYIKMAAMGVPYGNVEHKMKSEGVSPEDMLRVAVALGHGPAPKSTKSSSGVTDIRPSSVSRRSSGVSLVKMHWNTLPPEKLENSIWANNDEDSMEEKEMQELEKLFAASGNPAGGTLDGKGTAASAVVTDPRMKLYVLESRRAQNVVIGLSQYKGQKSHKEILQAVCRLDDINGSLNIDKLQNLSPLLPTLHEAKKMIAAKESQHPAEVFFNTAIQFYPELLKRLNCFLTCLTFADTSEVLLSKMRRIIEACNEVISSDSLARILQKMLTVGNLMNEGTYRGQASGFTLDSLLKMVHTRGVDKKTSVLDYVIKSLLERGEDRLLSLAETLEVSEETTRLSGRDASREIDHLLKDFHSLEEEFKKASRNEIEAAAVVDCTKEFTEKLSDFLDYAGETIKTVNKTHELMKRKIVSVVKYFGEDVDTCETTKIFSVIRQFIVAFESSRKTLIERRNRKQRK